MVIVWSKRAKSELDRLVDHIALESPSGAKRIAERS